MGKVDHTTPVPFPAYRTNCNFDARLTFTEICWREPLVLALADEIARLTRHGDDFCKNEVWYSAGGYKRRMCALVGILSAHPDPALRTAPAYDTVYQTLYYFLPECRHDGMCRWSPRWERD